MQFLSEERTVVYHAKKKKKSYYYSNRFVMICLFLEMNGKNSVVCHMLYQNMLLLHLVDNTVFSLSLY